jgi:hypothetical protein
VRSLSQSGSPALLLFFSIGLSAIMKSICIGSKCPGIGVY